MLLKTKGRCEKLWGFAGMYMKTKEMSAESGYVGENKGGRWYMVGRSWGMKNRGWELGSCPPPARASITRSIRPAAQETPPTLKRISFSDRTTRECC
jgi:hypothetical protein